LINIFLILLSLTTTII